MNSTETFACTPPASLHAYSGHFCFQSTSVCSALGSVLVLMRYINPRFTYLPT